MKVVTLSLSPGYDIVYTYYWGMKVSVRSVNLEMASMVALTAWYFTNCEDFSFICKCNESEMSTMRTSGWVTLLWAGRGTDVYSLHRITGTTVITGGP